ncbi:MAG: Sfum_1244 family protein [Thiobacillaceae bacterium]
MTEIAAAPPLPRASQSRRLDLAALINAVQRNCDISDAQYAGDLTLCTFLLKMRELYRWEHDIPLSANMPKGEVGDWMNARSALWEGIETDPYVPLPLPSGEVDPFEVGRVNAELLPHGLVYSGGYGRQCKPHFFLGQLLRSETRQGHRVLVSGCEYARDLDAPPGMMLDGTVFVRSEALKRWLWERYEEWRFNPKRNAAMARALAYYPFEHAPEAALSAMTANEIEAVILHELGEARVEAELGEDWGGLLMSVMRSRAEIMARAVRDLYADCLSTLPGLIEHGEPASLHFFFANFTGMRRKLAPELADAYQGWAAGGDLAGLRTAAEAGLERWSGMAHTLLALYRDYGEAVGPQIEALFGGQQTAPSGQSTSASAPTGACSTGN